MDPDKLKAAIEALKAQDGDAALKILEEMLIGAPTEDPAPEAGAEALGEGAEPKPEDPATLAAVSSLLMTLTGASTPGAAVEVFRGLKTRVDSLDADRAVIELSERRGLIADLVKLGAEVPATAWEGDAKDQKPAAHLSGPIVSLRERVAKVKAARGLSGGHKPPASGESLTTAQPGAKVITLANGATVTLSAADLAGCKKLNIAPEEFAARKAASVKRV